MELSHAEIERMRQIVKDHDVSRQPMKTIDLNNPPKEPYKYQKFPKMVYGDGNLTMLVHSEEELAQAIDDGWDEQAPVGGIQQPPTLSPQYEAEANRLQEQLEQSRRKPGRPRKDQVA